MNEPIGLDPRSPMNYERSIEFDPAYDKRKEGKDVRGVGISFVLKGSRGAIQFLILTNWCLPSVDANHMTKLFLKPMFVDVVYHSPVPMYDGQKSLESKCRCLDGIPCYCDGSTLWAKDVYQDLLTKGNDGVWECLVAYYLGTFVGGDGS